MYFEVISILSKDESVEGKKGSMPHCFLTEGCAAPGNLLGIVCHFEC